MVVFKYERAQNPDEIETETKCLLDAAEKRELNLKDIIYNKHYGGLTLLHSAACYSKKTLEQFVSYLDITSNNVVGSNICERVKIPECYMDSIGATPLHYAAKYNNFETVQYIIEHFEHYNGLYCADTNGATPFHWLAQGRMNAYDNLMNAAGMESSEYPRSQAMNIIKRLVDKRYWPNEKNMIGNRINNENKNGETPLHVAIQNANAEAIQSLILRESINLEAMNKKGETALHLAAASGLKCTNIQELLNKSDITAKDFEGNTPLHVAATTGNSNIVKSLIDEAKKRNLDLDEYINKIFNKSGHTAFTASIMGSSESFAMLLKEGGSITTASRNKLNYYPVHLACTTGNLSILKQLYDKDEGVINLQNSKLETPLHVACKHNNLEAVQFLTEKKADLNRKDTNYLIPLMISVRQVHAEKQFNSIQTKIIRRLIDAVAHCYEDSVLELPLHAAEFNNLNALEYWLKHCENKEAMSPAMSIKYFSNITNQDSNTPLHIAAKHGFEEIANSLIKYGADLSLRNVKGRTPFLVAIRYGHLKFVTMLLKNVNLHKDDIDKSGHTPLHLAAKYGHIGLVKILLGYTADIDRLNTDKLTALGEAITAGHAEIVTFLHSNNVNKCDEKEYNCFKFAIDNQQIDIAKIILEKSKNWQYCLRRDKKDDSSPLRELLKANMHEIVSIVFDKCITKEKEPDDEFKEKYNFEFFEDFYCQNKLAATTSDAENQNINILNSKDRVFMKKCHPLFLMKELVNAKANEHIAMHDELFMHPLVERYMNYKWARYRNVHYAQLGCYLLFIASLTVYIIIYPPPYPLADFSTLMLNDFCINEPNLKRHRVMIVMIVTIVAAILNLGIELYQISLQKWQYLKEPQNYVELPLYFATLVFFAFFNYNCSLRTFDKQPWQWNLGVLVVTLGYINLFLMLKKEPLLKVGLYFNMFSDILKTFLRFLLPFFIFVFAFALIFYMLLQNQVDYDNIFKAVIKTLVMMIGEFEYSTTFYSNKSYYPIISQIIYFLFAILMSILIMNLMVGIAVDNISGVQNRATMKLLALKAELILDVEFFLLPEKYQKHTDMLEDCPNKPMKGFYNKVRNLINWNIRNDVPRKNVDGSNYDTDGNPMHDRDIRLMNEIKEVKNSLSKQIIERRDEIMERLFAFEERVLLNEEEWKINKQVINEDRFKSLLNAIENSQHRPENELCSTKAMRRMSVS